MTVDTESRVIRMFRGESGSLTFEIPDVTFAANDRVIFTASKDENGEKPFFSKVLIPNGGTVVVDFRVEDTMDIKPGRYYYELELGLVPKVTNGKITGINYANGGAHRIARPETDACYRFEILATPAQIGVNGGLSNV